MYASDLSMREKVDAELVTAAIKGKRFFGMGLDY
jgi:hypothetical protein